jgi:drug/metabolite transporter (DMT)-like permease
MAISLSLLLPYVLITKKLKLPNKQILILAVLCGVLFASDVAVWNIAIQNSSATQASLFQFSSALGGYYLYVFLNTKPATNF